MLIIRSCTFLPEPFIKLTFLLLLLQVRVENKDMLKRMYHGAAALSVSSECVEVILFGGRSKTHGTDLANTAVLRFGRSYDI